MGGIFGGGSNVSVPPPDPAIGQAAMQNTAISKEALEFYKQQWIESRPRQAAIDDLSLKLGAQQLDIAEQNKAQAADQWQRYRNIFAPVEEQMVQDATTIDSKGEMDRAAGAASAGVQSQFDNAMGQNRRAMLASGVNPNSGKALALQSEGALGLAAAKAGAATGARLNARDRGIALRAGAANFGRNMPNTASNAYGVAVQGGNSAMGNSATAANANNAAISQMGQGFGTAIQGNTAAGSLLNQQYGNQLNAWSAQQAADANSSSGFGSLMGTVGTIGAAALLSSSKKIKTDKRPIKDAEVLKGIRKTPVESWKYKDGVEDEGEHIGPYAEDINKAFGDKAAPGGKMIDIISMMGINMKATQALDRKLQQVEKKIGHKRDQKKTGARVRGKGGDR